MSRSSLAAIDVSDVELKLWTYQPSIASVYEPCPKLSLPLEAYATKQVAVVTLADARILKLRGITKA